MRRSPTSRLAGPVLATALALAASLALVVPASPPSAARPTAVGTNAATAAPSTVPGAARFVALGPARLLDTRPGGPTVDGLGSGGGKVAQLGSRHVQVTGRAGIPATASAVALNVTAVDASWGFVQVMATNRASIGSSSNLNISQPGEIVANMVVVPVGDGGRVTIFTQGPAHFVADVVGYFVPAATATSGRYEPVQPEPVRLMDTRLGVRSAAGVITNPGDAVNCSDFTRWADANAWFWKHQRAGFGDVAKLDSNGDGIPCEGLAGAAEQAAPPAAAELFPMGRGEERRLRLPAGVASASAVVLNVTATGTTGSGFVQARPTGGATPPGSSSNLNLRAGQTRANLVIVPVLAEGSVTLLHHAGGHLVVDFLGSFTTTAATSGSAGLFVPVTPARALDTRAGPRPAAASRTRLAPLGTHGLPRRGVAALMLTVTATDVAGSSYVSILRPGHQPLTSTLNVERAGQTVPNAAVAALPASATLELYTHAASHLLADVAGYFLGEP